MSHGAECVNPSRPPDPSILSGGIWFHEIARGTGIAKLPSVRRNADTLDRESAPDQQSRMKALYTAHADAITRFVRARMRDEAETADIVHDTRLSVWRAASAFKADARDGPQQDCRPHPQAGPRDPRVPDEEIPDGDPDPGAALEAAQDTQRLRACVEDLPTGQRAVIHLAYFEEMTCAAIAEASPSPRVR